MLPLLPSFKRHERLLLMVGLVCIALRIITLLILIKYPLGYDARSYVAAAQALVQGSDIYNFHRTVPMGLYLYPPLLAVLLIPLANLSVVTGSYICVVLSLITVIVLIIVLHYFVGWKISFLSVIIFSPTWHTVYLGQVNLLIAAFAAISFLFFIKNKEYAVGISLALGTLIKVTPLLNVYVLIRNKYYNGIVSYVMTIFLIFTLTLFFVRPNTWLFGVLAALNQHWTSPEFVSWTGMSSHFLGGMGEILGVIITVSFLAVTLIRVSRISIHFALAACTLLPLLIARITWDHHLVMVLPVFAMLWYKEAELRKPIVFAWLLLGLGDGIFLPTVVTLCWACCCWPQLLPTFLARRSAQVSF